MSLTVQSSSHYVSDEQLLAWVATRQDNLYADLSDSMDLSEERHEMVSKLVDLKLALQNAQQTGNFEEANDALAKFAAEYENSVEYHDAAQTIEGISKQVASQWGEVSRAHEDNPDVALTLKLDPQLLKDWSSSIDDRTSGINQNDQLGMVHVQQLKSNIDQTAQAASALMAGTDKAVDSIIGNVG